MNEKTLITLLVVLGIFLVAVNSYVSFGIEDITQGIMKGFMTFR